MKLKKFNNFKIEESNSSDDVIGWYKDLIDDLELNYEGIKIISKERIQDGYIMCRIIFSSFDDNIKEEIKEEIRKGIENIEEKTTWGITNVYYTYDGKEFLNKSDHNNWAKSFSCIDFLESISRDKIVGLGFRINQKLKSLK